MASSSRAPESFTSGMRVFSARFASTCASADDFADASTFAACGLAGAAAPGRVVWASAREAHIEKETSPTRINAVLRRIARLRESGEREHGLATDGAQMHTDEIRN